MHAWSGIEGGDIMGPTIAGTESAKANTPPLKNGNDLRESGYLIAVGSRTARFRRRHVHKLRNSVIMLLFVLLLVAFFIMLILYIRARHRPVLVCLSKQCLQSASNLAVSMDTTVDPCDDFYKYACGNWASDHPRPDMYASYDWFRDKQRKVYALVRDMLAKNTTGDLKPVMQAKDFYASCMNTAKLEKIGLKPVFKVLESLKLPPYPTHINASGDIDLSTYSFDWLESVIKIKTQLGMDVLIGFDIYTDPKNSSVFRLVMGSPETTNPFPSLYHERRKHSYRKSNTFFDLFRTYKKPKVKPLILSQNDYNNRKRQTGSNVENEADKIYRLFYAELIKIFAQESGKLPDVSALSESEFDSNIILSANDFYELSEEVYELEVDNSTEPEENLAFSNIPEYTINEIQLRTDNYTEINNETPQPIWKRYLEGIFNGTKINLDFEQDKVLVSSLDMKYMEKIALLVSKTHPAVLELYIWIKVVEVLAVHTTKELRLLYYRSYDSRHKHHSDLYFPPRSLQCATAVNDMFGMAVSYALVEPNFYNITTPKVFIMIRELKNALASLIGKVKWMDDNTKLATYKKIIEMNAFIGYPQWFYVPGKLEEYYEGIEISRDTYIENMVNIIQVRTKKNLNRLRDSNYFSWATDPTEVNAYHTFQENTITVPMVMLQYPFFDLGLDSLNYGSLGTVIGHEITHGFDNFGREFDRNGNLLPWWSNDTIANYVNITQCFVDQYSSYYISVLDKHVDGNKTLGENIADNGGLREAFVALKHHLRKFGPEPKLPGFERMTSEQMFFLSYANLWCGVSTDISLAQDLDDEHSPQMFRARGTLQNSEDFAETFKCRPGSRMNPHKKRCIIF
ncbi:endothelin-converting enzyme 2 [Amyelois transitella]|uniref:endothelin-converting enzyme 2 n=1 Tax=Amyelois transitella TaxID=680683 RepID=UPI0029905ABE|nr:endothelin-converting enzyme 2 [Amyelois transitella]